jgi:hypothetical protein
MHFCQTRAARKGARNVLVNNNKTNKMLTQELTNKLKDVATNNL